MIISQTIAPQGKLLNEQKISNILHKIVEVTTENGIHSLTYFNACCNQRRPAYTPQAKRKHIGSYYYRMVDRVGIQK